MNETLERFIQEYKETYDCYDTMKHPTEKRKYADDLAVLNRAAKLILTLDEYDQFIKEAQ